MAQLHELKAIPIFSDLEDAELLELSEKLIERKIPKGSFILYADDPGKSLLFITDGKVKITLSSDDGKEIVIRHFNKGDFFGELALLTNDSRSANVVAMTDCTLLVLPEEAFKQHIEGANGFTKALLSELALRLRASSEKIGDLALFDVYRRVARTLKSIAEEKEIDGKVSWVIEERSTHQELASMVGTSREMVTRALKALEEDGCIVTDGKRIFVEKMPR